MDFGELLNTTLQLKIFQAVGLKWLAKYQITFFSLSPLSECNSNSIKEFINIYKHETSKLVELQVCFRSVIWIIFEYFLTRRCKVQNIFLTSTDLHVVAVSAINLTFPFRVYFEMRRGKEIFI